MSLDLLAAIETVRVPFINWQYVYCWFAGLFGAGCRDDVTVPTIDVPNVSGLTDVATTTATVAIDTVRDTGGGFWSWLWPFGEPSSAIDTVSSGTTALDMSWWTYVSASVPEPVLAFVSSVGSVLSVMWGVFSAVSFTISGALFVLLLTVLVLFTLLRLREWRTYGALSTHGRVRPRGTELWQNLLDAAMTPEPKRWREALLAADEILGSILGTAGFDGRTTAERLRVVPDGAFVSLPQAWEAHRIKNFVIQRSSNYILTQRETFRVMKLYEQVFEEFDFI